MQQGKLVLKLNLLRMTSFGGPRQPHRLFCSQTHLATPLRGLPERLGIQTQTNVGLRDIFRNITKKQSPLVTDGIHKTAQLQPHANRIYAIQLVH